MIKILIIEDDDSIRRMMRIWFEREGYAVLDAADGGQGLAHLKENTVDLMITDIIMPNVEGIELIREVKKNYPALPIIAISGGGRLAPEPYLKLADATGADYSFVKPVPKKEMMETVQKILASAGKPAA